MTRDAGLRSLQALEQLWHGRRGERVDHILHCEYAFNVWHWGRTVFADPKDLKL